MLQNRDIIIFGDDWGRHPSTIQHIASVLSKTNRVLWVGSLGLRSPRFKLYDLKRIAEKFSKFVSPLPRRRNLGDIVELHPFIIPFYDFRLVRSLNNLLLRRKILRQARKLNFSDVVLLVSTPVACDIVGTLGERSSYYLCFDDYSSFDFVFRSIRDMERQIADSVDGCFAISDFLLEILKPKNNENHYLPQGVDVEHFLNVPGTMPDDVRNVKKPIVGFFGLITTWIDLDLVYECAKANSTVSFVFIGRTMVDLSKLKELDNFLYLGEVPYENLPGYAQSFDVGIVPFVLNELTMASNPIKILEYLALGLPVISTDLPEARKFSGSIFIAGSKKEFISLIEIALKRNSSLEKEERRGLAKKHSWDAICDILSYKVQKIEDRKSQK